MPSDNVKAFYIFEKHSGSTLFSKTYQEEFGGDPILVVAFLTAMFNFAQETTLSELKTLDMEAIRFQFIEREIDEQNSLVFAVMINRFTSSLDIEFKLITIATLFLDRFQEELENPDNLNIVNTRIFNPFERTVDEVILGETRGMDVDSKGAISLNLQILISSTSLSGAALYGFTGEVLINMMDEDVRQTISQLFPREPYNWLFIEIRGRVLLFYPMNEISLTLVVSCPDESPLDVVIEHVKKTVKKIREITGLRGLDSRIW
ncbi:MAG: hypothetical protein ACFFBD_04200 [Candidatus Hodarchaeota archaeon]